VTYVDGAIHEPFVGGKVYMEITQLPVDVGYRTPNGQRFHFEFSVAYVGIEYAVLTPINDTLHLRRPIPFLDNVTLRLYQNSVAGIFSVRKITLYDEAFQVTVVPGSNPAQFNTANSNVARNIGPPGVVFASPSIEAYFSGFNTNDSTFNSDITQVTARVSLMGPGSGNTLFEVAGVSAAAVASGDLTGKIFLPKNKIDICLRCTCILPTTENYVTTIHL
jgi:hypothetical protein